MLIGGLQRFSMIDFPGQLAAVLFTQGCMFRCHYCHNPELVLPERYRPLIDERSVLEFLKSRQGKLDGVAITGGEPTLHPDLPDFIRQIRELGFKVKLDTAGVLPDRVEAMLDAGLLDYVAMDIKAPLERYPDVVGKPVDTRAISRSVELLKTKAPDYEFRTTVVEGLLDQEDLLQIATWLQGAKRYALQRFVPTDTVNPAYHTRQPMSDQLLDQVCQRIETDHNIPCLVR